jgi:pimeloyl-ACP methyl ester carboxylesterase
MAPALEPIVGRYLTYEIEGRPYRVYFEEAGQGTPLVCLHTAGAHSSQYRHLMCDPAVTDRFRVLAFDLPWHGKSNPPVGWQDQEYKLTADFYVAAVTGFCDAMGLDRPVVMGCSMGGRVVVRLAVERPELFRAVIGLEGSNRPSPWYDNSWLDSPEFQHGDFCAALVSGLCAPQSPDEFRWETLWHYHQGGSGVFLGDMHFYRTDSDFEDASGRIDGNRCRVVLMTGEYDYSCTPADTERTAARIPGATAIIMREMGHFPMSENPAKFRDYLLPVLDDIAQAG